MIAIRQDQLDQWQKKAQASFDARLNAHLSANLPADAAEQLEQTLPQALALARQSGLTGEQDLARFATIACAVPGGPAALPPQALAGLLAFNKAPAAKLNDLETWAKSNGHPTPPPPPPGFSDNPPGTVVQACPLQQKQVKTHWIEIELIGEDDRPIPWAQYKVVLPNGQTTTGYLDGDGYARFEQLESAGSCQILFPELDQEAVTFLESAAQRPTSHAPA